MATLNDYSAEQSFPPSGTHLAKIVNAQKQVSTKKKTPFLELTIVSGVYEFTDALFITEKAINRLAILAKRLCKMSGDTELNDDKAEAAKELANHIMTNIIGTECFVTIEENTETYIPESGPDIGKPKKFLRKRVAYAGYSEVTEELKQKLSEISNEIDADAIPF